MARSIVSYDASLSDIQRLQYGPLTSLVNIFAALKVISYLLALQLSFPRVVTVLERLPVHQPKGGFNFAFVPLTSASIC